MTITLEDLKKSHIKEQAHFTGQGFFGYIMANVEFPRLTRKDVYLKKDRSVVSTWRVDGEEVIGLEGAVEKLNVPPNLTREEAAALELVPTEFTNLKSVRMMLGAGDASQSFTMIHRLNELGQLEYGRDTTPPDGGWHEAVPDHLRFTPTIRRRKEG